MINKELLQNGVKSTFNFFKKNSPHVLTGIGIVGVGVTSFFAVKGVIRAKDIIEEERIRRECKLVDDCEKNNLYPENNNEPPRELIKQQCKISFKDAVKLTWKPLLPMVVSGITTIACIVGSDVINSGRNAALLAVATASEKALEEYQKKNVELFGEKNNEKILDQNAKDKVKESDLPEEDMILKTYHGDMLILDDWNGRYFRGSRDMIDKAINSMNYDMYETHSMFNDGYISLNDFYDNIGINEKTQNGDYLGWNRRHPITIDYRSALKDDSVPVLVMSFKNMPLPDYALDRIND